MKQKVEVNTSVLVFCLDYCDSMLRVRDMFLISQKHEAHFGILKGTTTRTWKLLWP